MVALSVGVLALGLAGCEDLDPWPPAMSDGADAGPGDIDPTPQDTDAGVAWVQADAGPESMPDQDAGPPRFAREDTIDREGPGVFVAVGYSLRRIRSVDGIEWTDDVNLGPDDTSKPNLLRGVGAGPAGFIAVGAYADGAARAFLSPDGIAWTETRPPGGGFYSDVVYGNGTYLAAGGAGRTARTTDGVTWAEPVTVAPDSFRALTFGGGYFAAVGDWGIRALSPDGVTWESVVKNEGDADRTVGMLGAVGYGAGRFVAAGNDGCRRVTFDGETWGNDESSQSGIHLNAVLHVRDRFWVFGTRLYVSDTAEAGSWEEHPVPAELKAVTYGGGRFVGVGRNVVYVSEDGFTWSRTELGGAGFWDIAFLPDR